MNQESARKMVEAQAVLAEVTKAEEAAEAERQAALALEPWPPDARLVPASPQPQPQAQVFPALQTAIDTVSCPNNGMHVEHCAMMLFCCAQGVSDLGSDSVAPKRHSISTSASFPFLQPNPRTLILRLMPRLMLMDLRRGMQLHQSSPSLWGLAGMTGNSRHSHDQCLRARSFICSTSPSNVANDEGLCLRCGTEAMTT